MMYQIVYDGSFEGFLSAYHFYRENGSVESVVNKNLKSIYQPSIYSVEIATDFQKVKELIEKFNFKLIEKGEEIPFIDIWTKKRVVKFFIIVYLIASLGFFTIEFLSFSPRLQFYLIIIFSASFFIYLGFLIYYFFKEKSNRKKLT